MKRFGIRMSGCEEPLESLIKQHLAVHSHSEYTLIEVGSAGCVTLRAFRDILAENAGTKSWRAVGFDLTLDKAWSVNMDEVTNSMSGVESSIYAVPLGMMGTDLGFDLGKMTLILHHDPRGYLAGSLPYGFFPHTIDFAFIDASHGKSVGHDFLAIESKVRPGGLVVFHDYGEPEQGSDWQDFDREFIAVRSYVHRLGLNTPSPKGVLRKGWRFVGEIKGSRHWNGEGNSCAVVQRTYEPLADQPELTID